MVSKRSLRRAGQAMVLAALLYEPAARAQEVSTSVVLGTTPALRLEIRYQDPVAMFSRLRGTLVFPVWVTAQNISARATALTVTDLRLTIGSSGGSTVELTPITAAEAQRRLRSDARMGEVLGWLTRGGGDWAPNPFERALASGRLAPSRTRNGYVFFLRPAGFEFNGFMAVAAAGHPAELLPTSIVNVGSRPRASDAGVVERFVKAASTLPGLSPLPDLVYGRPFGRSYALLFGISSYDGTGRNLPGAAHDVVRMAAFLNAQGFDSVVTLSDRQVTESALRNVQAHFASRIGPEDRLLVYYAGHGQRSQAGADLVLSSGARVPMDRFMRWLGDVRVKHLLVLLDACYSGTVIRGVRRDVLEPLDRRTRDVMYALASEGSRFVISAGDANEVANEDVAAWGGGLFTNAVLQALRPQRTGVDIVTTYDLLGRVQRYVTAEVLKHRLTAQLPRIRDLGYGPSTPPELSRGQFVFVSSR